MDNNYTMYEQQNIKQGRLYVFFQNNISEVQLYGYQTLGRPSTSSNPSIAINSNFVSRNHGEFSTNEYGTVFRDMGSTNGTIYNGHKLDSGSQVTLQNGDVLRVHGHDDSHCSMDAILIYSDNYGNYEWNTMSLAGAGEINIGRSEALRFTNPEVSRRHAAFFKSSRGWAVIDQGSTNGVYCNNERVLQPRHLKRGDVIRVVCYFFIFMGDTLYYQCDSSNAYANQQVMNYSQWSDRSFALFNNGYNNQMPVMSGQQYYGGQAGYGNMPQYGYGGLEISIQERSVWKFGRKKMLLKDINLNIPTGNMVLILGGSGAGKTTFMNAVMGYEQAKGCIRYNGTDIYAEFDRMQFEIGYVPQQDLMRMNDIALDTVVNAAQLKLQAGMPDYFYIQQAENAMNTLGLADEKRQMVRALSGGQRKRLSIAMEYVGNPSLFFLDEPDSGVDNTNSELLLNNLRSITNEGKIVMFISHSPDRAIKLTDKVIILAKDSYNDCGRLVFYGNPYDALKFFEVSSLNKIVSRINKVNEGGEGLADYYIEKYEREAHLYG